MKGDPSSFPIPRLPSPSEGAVPGAAGFPHLPVASLSSLGPLTEAVLFVQNVTGLAAVDLVRDNARRIVRLVADGGSGPRRVSIAFHYDDGSL
jgi:hypothetical protein